MLYDVNIYGGFFRQSGIKIFFDGVEKEDVTILSCDDMEGWIEVVNGFDSDSDEFTTERITGEVEFYMTRQRWEELQEMIEAGMS